MSSLKKGSQGAPFFARPAPAGGGGGAIFHRPGRGRLRQHGAVSFKKREPGGSLFCPACPSWRRRGNFPPPLGGRAASAARGSEFFKKGGESGGSLFCLACPSWRRRGSCPPPPGERAASAAQGCEFFEKKRGSQGAPFFARPAPAGGGGGTFRHRPGRRRLWQHRAVSPGGSHFFAWPAPAGGGGGTFRHRPGGGRLWEHRAVSLWGCALFPREV